MLTFTEYEQLFEIGDSKAEPFEWKLTKDLRKDYLSQLVYYTIKSKNVQYVVTFAVTFLRENDFEDFDFSEFKDYEEIEVFKNLVFADIDFGLDDGRPSLAMSGANEVYQLMATIMEIVKDLLKRHKNVINVLTFSAMTKGIKSYGETTKNPFARGNLYQAYIEKNLKKLYPKATWRKIDNNNYYIVLDKYPQSIINAIENYCYENSL